MEPEVCRGNLLGEGLRVGKAARHALRVPMGQTVRFAPKEGCQQVTSDRKVWLEQKSGRSQKRFRREKSSGSEE